MEGLVLLVLPHHASAQDNVPAQAQQVAADVQNVVDKYGLGVRAGVGLNPELIDVGAHATFGPIFVRTCRSAPGSASASVR